MYHPKHEITPRFARLLENIAEVRERIRGSLVHVPWVPSLVKDAMARAAWGSTAIEGCTLSLEAVRGLLEGKETPNYPEKHVRMAKNYLRALAWLEKKEKVNILEESQLLELHTLLAKGAVEEGPVGAYRKVDVRAGLHVGAPWRKVGMLMQELLDWLNGPARELPSVVVAAILHFRTVDIHPFRDGNGRIARALSTWELYRKGFDTLHVFALDEVLQEHRPLYIKNLQRVQIEGWNLGGWIEFIAEAILETLQRVDKRIQAIGPRTTTPISISIRQEKLLTMLREHGAVGIREIAMALHVTTPGAHYVLRPLLGAGLVRRMGSHKGTKYTLARISLQANVD